MSRQNIAIAMTDRVRKTLLDTLKSLPRGSESAELLEQMYKGTREDKRARTWWLFHDDYIKWWPKQNPVVGNIDEILHTLIYDDQDRYIDEISVVIIDDHPPDDIATQRGGGDPFDLGYPLKISYDLN